MLQVHKFLALAGDAIDRGCQSFAADMLRAAAKQLDQMDGDKRRGVHKEPRRAQSAAWAGAEATRPRWAR
jgi:hypothetical protein